MNHTLHNKSTSNDPWIRRITLFLTSQTISLFGSSVVAYAIIWHITLTTGSGLIMTISTLCTFLPQIVISIYAGVWADRYHRKRLIIISDLLIAITTLFLALFFFMGFQELWLLFLASAIRSVGTGIQTPAVNALIPQIVPEDKLMKVNGINGSLQSLIFIVAPAVSGGILTATTLEYTFIIDVVTAIIGVSILCFISIPIHDKAMAVPTTKAIEDLKEGLSYIKNHQFIYTLFIFYGIVMFLITPVAFLTPLLIAREYGNEVWRLTYNEIAFSGGTMLGGLFIAIWGGFKRRIRTIALGCFLFGLSVATLGIVNNFWLYIGFIFLSGLMIAFLSAPSNVLLQEQVDTNMQGRVFSIMVLISTTAFPLGMIFFGPIADIFQIEILLIITGLIMAFTGILILKNKALNQDFL
ncbi:MAG: MFS transporter [Eubacteriaceae bacterium]